MKKVLLLGAGYANLGLLTTINKELFAQTQWSLINNTPYHYKTISLHDVASGKHDKSILFPLREVVHSDVNLIEDSVIEIQSQKVIGKNATYEYDYLVVGLGFSSDSFGIPGVAQYTQSITSYNTARQIYEKITQTLQNYIEHKDSNDLSFVVCGGGFTGIEFAGSLAQELQKQCDARGIDFKQVRIYCIEAMPKILPMFSENLMQLGLQRLRQLGVEVLTSSKILECKQGSVVIEQNGNQNEIQANTIIWTAGVKGNEVIANSPFFKSGRSKVEVNEWLQPINQENDMQNIFVIGDCAALKDPSSGRFYPPTAQLAKKQGEYLAKNLEMLLNTEAINQTIDIQSLPKLDFQPQGSICSIGQGYSVGVVGSREIKGFSASLLKWLIESQWSYQLGGLGGVFKGD